MTAKTTSLTIPTLNTYLNSPCFTLQLTVVHHFFPKGLSKYSPALLFILHNGAFNFLVSLIMVTAVCSNLPDMLQKLHVHS